MEELLKEALDMLYAIQWSSSDTSGFNDSDGTQFSYCPCCDQVEYKPHEDDCELKILIEKIKKAIE